MKTKSAIDKLVAMGGTIEQDDSHITHRQLNTVIGRAAITVLVNKADPETVIDIRIMKNSRPDSMEHFKTVRSMADWIKRLNY